MLSCTRSARGDLQCPLGGRRVTSSGRMDRRESAHFERLVLPDLPSRVFLTQRECPIADRALDCLSGYSVICIHCMEIGDYQRLAKDTDQTPGNGEFRTALQVLALQSKIGDLSGVFKKYFRKQASQRALDTTIDRAIGDILWYLSAIASSRNLPLDDIAQHNLLRVRRRYGEPDPNLFDPRQVRIDFLREAFPDDLCFDFYCFDDLAGRKIMQVRVIGPDGQPIGDDIDDNEYKEDHYRYHDALHIAFMTFIGWSPVMRKLPSVKRKSSEIIDRIEDGAKARDIEEVDTDLLTEIPGFLGERESIWITEAAWEIAILESAKIIRELIAHEGGRVISNLRERTLVFEAHIENSS